MANLSYSLEIRAALRSEKAIVWLLLQLYLHDFSDFAAPLGPYGDVDERGEFECPYFDSYWSVEGRKPLLFQVNGHLAGFALLHRWSASGKPTDWAMAEFFVVRKYRRVGIGTRAARDILGRHQCVWEIAVADYNEQALIFWRRAVAGVGNFSLEMLNGDGERWSGPILRLTPVS